MLSSCNSLISKVLTNRKTEMFKEVSEGISSNVKALMKSAKNNDLKCSVSNMHVRFQPARTVDPYRAS